LSAARQLLAKGREGESGEGFQAIVLVTDGEDLEGQWEKEAEACRKEGIRVIPVGVGSTDGGLIPAFDRQGRPAGYLKDDEGNVVTTHLNLQALEELGTIGGAGTFRLGVDGLAGDRLFRELQRLGRRDLEDRRVSAYQERFVWPLSLSIACLLLRLGLRPWRRATASVMALLAILVGLGAPATASAGLVRDGAAAAAEGRRLYGQGDYQGALTAFEGAVVQAPDDPVLSLAVGETLFRLERYPEATREFERVLTLTDDPELRAEALYNRGTAALAAGDSKAAIKDLRASLDIDPGQQDAALNLEAALRRLQQEQQQKEQEKDQDKDKEKKEEDDKQQEQQEQQQQEQQQQQQQQEQQEQQEQQQQQEQQEQQEQKQQEQQEQQSQEKQQPPRPEGTPPPELTDEQAAQILKALDRDEEELKRSLQKRVQGGRSRSGKRW